MWIVRDPLHIHMNCNKSIWLNRPLVVLGCALCSNKWVGMSKACWFEDSTCWCNRVASRRRDDLHARFRPRTCWDWFAWWFSQIASARWHKHLWPFSIQHGWGLLQVQRADRANALLKSAWEQYGPSVQTLCWWRRCARIRHGHATQVILQYLYVLCSCVYMFRLAGSSDMNAHLYIYGIC